MTIYNREQKSASVSGEAAYRQRNAYSLLGGVATLALTTAVLAGSSVQENHHPGHEDQRRADQSNSQDVRQKSTPLPLNHEARQAAAEFINDKDMVTLISLRAMSSSQQMVVAEHGVKDNHSLRIITADNMDYIRGEDDVSCTEDDNYSASPITVNATLYPSRLGSLSIQVEKPKTPETCLNISSEESVSVVLEITHDGVKNFTLEEGLQQAANRPDDVNVSAVAVKRLVPREDMRVSNTALGSGLRGQGFRVERNGQDVTVNTLSEARRHADDVTRSAAETIQRS